MKNKIILTPKEESVLFDSCLGWRLDWYVLSIFLAPPNSGFQTTKELLEKPSFWGWLKNFDPAQFFDPPPPPGAAAPLRGAACRVSTCQLSQPTPSGRRLRRSRASVSPSSAPASVQEPTGRWYGCLGGGYPGLWVWGSRVQGGRERAILDPLPPSACLPRATRCPFEGRPDWIVMWTRPLCVHSRLKGPSSRTRGARIPRSRSPAIWSTPIEWVQSWQVDTASSHWIQSQVSYFCSLTELFLMQSRRR